MQKRLPKLERSPEKLRNFQITDRSLALISAIERYKFLPTSMLLQLASGNPAVSARHLQRLYHIGLINRFCTPRHGGSGEFIYYIDETRTLELLVSRGFKPEALDWNIIRRNKSKAYFKLSRTSDTLDASGRMLFLKHELLITRFHALLELACRPQDSDWRLGAWLQGPPSWKVLTGKAKEAAVVRLRPDAFFSLQNAGASGGKVSNHFFYEADRGTATNVERMRQKFETYCEFFNRDGLPEYGISRVRAVVMETNTVDRAERLCTLAADVASGMPLFWFTCSQAVEKAVPYPQSLLGRIWMNCASTELLSLCD